jgi:hypothetical protein
MSVIASYANRLKGATTPVAFARFQGPFLSKMNSITATPIRAAIDPTFDEELAHST